MRRVFKVIGFCILISVCALAQNSSPALTVFAASSLTDAFKEMGEVFKAENPGTGVAFNFTASNQARAQLEQGAQADVFAAASAKDMDTLVQDGLVAAEAVKLFAHNELVVIVPANNPAHIENVTDLAKVGVKLVVADESVPVGRYTAACLGRLAELEHYGKVFRAQALANVVSREENVRAVLAKVRMGEADAGIVYVTDALSAGKEVRTIDIPEFAQQKADYPMASLIHASRPDVAQKFIEFVLSEKGRQILGNYGFILP